jgi:hypothetical protein
VNPDELEKYKQVYRFYWYKNQLIISKAIPLLRAFEKAGMDYLLLKGVPLAYKYYSNPGLRPFFDVDILVHPADALKAYSLLQQRGLIPSRIQSPKDVILFRHAQDFISSSGISIDLHWKLLYRDWGNRFNDTVWNKTADFKIGNIGLRTLNSSAHLLQTCIHGVEWNHISSVRWAADAEVLIENGEIDWEWMIQEAESRFLTDQLKRQLDYLSTFLELDIPAKVISGLANSNRWRWEKLETNLITRPPNIFSKLLGYWFLHLRNHPSITFSRNLITFPDLLKKILEIKSIKDLFPSLLRKLLEWI